jgi:transcriptional regulator with XRE-family HTH domain
MQQQDAAHVVAEAARQYAEELGRWRQQRRLSKQKLATLMTYDRSYVSHVESGSLPPTEDFTRRAEAVLNTASALWARWEAYEAARIGNARASSRSVDRLEPIASERQRDLKVSPFVAWVADHSRLSFQDAYGVVVRGVERLAARGPADRYAEAHRRAQITRDQLARALATYYQNPSPHELGATFYSARVDGVPLALSILVRPDWLGAAVRLGTNQERFQLAAPDVGTAVRLPEGPALEAALRRLAAAETSATVMVNNPLYRLQDVALSRQRLQATVTLTDFADYALTMDLLETELVDALATAGRGHGDGRGGATVGLPLRDVYLPTVASALTLSDRLCVGGPVALLAAARPSTRHGQREPDYVLLVQERSARVLNVTGRLAVVPKAFHGPTTEAAEEAHLSASLERELEEELLGREDLEQVSERSFRRIDPFHTDQLSEPMRWLVERRQTDAYRVECVGFGINMVTGNYEFPCLILIDDEEWWERYSGQIEANWEMARVRRYSSRDTAGLQALAADPRWSNEGLFAFLEGLRRLAELDTVSRVAVPEIEVGA